MLGDFITRGLVSVLGYAYPAFECFKTLEKNRVEIEELRFWCQYWIIIAVLTVCERFGDIFISWLPLYGEMKLALFIFLWHPKTKGSRYVYGNILRPYVARYEADIDRNLQEMKARAWDLATQHFQNWTKMGHTTFIQIIQYLASQPAKVKKRTSEEAPGNEQALAPPTPSPSPSPRAPSSLPSTPKKLGLPTDKRRPPIHPPTHSATFNRAVTQSPKSNAAAKVHLHSQTEFIHNEDDGAECDGRIRPGSADESDGSLDQSLQAARLRLRRSIAFH